MLRLRCGLRRGRLWKINRVMYWGLEMV